MTHLLIILLLLLPLPSRAAIVYDTSSTSGGTNSTSHSHTIAADANIVLVCSAVRITTGGVFANTGVTVGGEAATLLDAQTHANNVVRVELWYKLAPATGSQTVAVTGHASTAHMATGVISFKNVAQTSTFNTVSKTQATGSDVDIDGLASAIGEVGFFCGASRGIATTASADATSPVSTERFDFAQGCNTCIVAFGYTEDGDTTSINMRVDISESVQHAAVGVSMRPAAEVSNRRQMPVFYP